MNLIAQFALDKIIDDVMKKNVKVIVFVSIFLGILIEGWIRHKPNILGVNCLNLNFNNQNNTNNPMIIFVKEIS